MTLATRKIHAHTHLTGNNSQTVASGLHLRDAIISKLATFISVINSHTKRIVHRPYFLTGGERISLLYKRKALARSWLAYPRIKPQS